jgi:predicted ATPase
MWTSIAHRTALLLLDNLEQIDGADTVVTELLQHAPQAVVLATSRRPVNVLGELQHAVPPLELPDNATLGAVEKSGAVQMFVQHARAVKAGFALNAANAADVAAVCSRLDGLPLAIELAAARIRLLSPAALLTRLDGALDIAASGSHRPTRQKTLRDTIAWSYDLLNAAEQAFFRRLGVFAGGADVDAIRAVTADLIEAVDPLEPVAELVDASLVSIGEDAVGEPRVSLLETIRAFALDQLTANGEMDSVRERHALYYLSLTEQLRPGLVSGAAAVNLQVRNRLVAEYDDLAEALGWALRPAEGDKPVRERVSIALGICASLCPGESNFWADAVTSMRDGDGWSGRSAWQVRTAR